MAMKYGIAMAAYDYTGDGESEMDFESYQEDLKVVLAWILRQGYKMNKVVLCGFSLGSYSALCLQGQMARLLISPICGIISFFETEAARYEGEKYDNIKNALSIRSRAMILHCSDEMVHISHGRLLYDAFVRVNGP